MFGIGEERERVWEAFEAEALPLMGDVFRIAMWLARSHEEAEDLTQETFAQALKSFHRYTPGTNCRAWLVTILYHTDSRRRLRLRRLKIVEDTEEQIARTVAFVPSIPQQLHDEEILAALKKIRQQYREVVVLIDVEEFSYKEAAEFLGVPIGTVMSRLHRGRKLLRQELTGHARKTGIGANDQGNDYELSGI
jgi:RNA polymerase sigma-70 factor (ECF subfamily)